MKLFLALALAVLSLFATSQITSGNNYFRIGGVALNGESGNITKYPVYTDTTGTDSIVYAGNNNINFNIGYQVAVARFLSVGVSYRALQNESSSFILKYGGFNVRYHFALGKPRTSGNQIQYVKNSEPARNFLFLDVEASYGTQKYQNVSEKFNQYSLSLGGSLRVPAKGENILGRFGLEVAFGVCMHNKPELEPAVYPIARGGLQFYLDKKYTKVVPLKD